MNDYTGFRGSRGITNLGGEKRKKLQILLNVFVLFTLHFILFTTSFTYENDRRDIEPLHLEIPVIPKGFFPL